MSIIILPQRLEDTNINVISSSCPPEADGVFVV